MDLYKTLEESAKKALKEGDSVKLSVLRMLLADIKTFQIDKKIDNPKEAELIQIVQRHIKRHKESIEQFRKGNRRDLVDKETEELEILEKYMPKQLSESELLAVIKEAVAATGASGKSDMGKVMKAVMEKVEGAADGKLVNQLISGILK
jgi:uncharacterized protein